MAKQVINTGSSANDRSGDPLRTAFTKVNENFTELYNLVGSGGGASVGNWTFTGDSATVTGTTAQIGKNSSETITQEMPGGAVSQTTTNTSQVEIDATSIVITRSVTQVVNDGVTTATDEAGSVASIGNGSAYLKTYSEPDGPNNTQYTEVGTSGSYAYLESRQDDLGGYTLGGVVTGPGTVSITTHSTDDKTWLFDQAGILTLPAGGDIVNSTGTSVLGGASYDQSLNTNNDVTFSSVTSTTNIKAAEYRLGNYIRSYSSAPVNIAGAASDVVYSFDNWFTSAKIIIQVEGNVDGDSTFVDHTQTCEAVIAATYNTTADPVMTVYGIVHTSVAPLATFTIRRGTGIFAGKIELLAQNSQTTSNITVKVQAVQFVSRYD